MGNYAIVIHGGAATLMTGALTPEKANAYNVKLSESLQAGYNILSNGGSAVDAVEVTVRLLEDSPLFNAGKGSVFNCDGINEMDASIMNGKNLKAGAIAAVHTIKNPISAARAVMEKSNLVLLAAAGAEKFAKECGLEIVPNSYFYDEERYRQWVSTKDKDGASWSGDTVTSNFSAEENGLFLGDSSGESEIRKYGTVGAVALDSSGSLAAATSTGGINNKKYGRVGDSPIIGAGTYADNKTCAVSCTGEGEYFIRNVAAYDISALMEYKGLSLLQATAEVMKKIAFLGGEGGLIALDKDGNIATPFNTSSMFRGWINSQGEKFTGIFR